MACVWYPNKSGEGCKKAKTLALENKQIVALAQDWYHGSKHFGTISIENLTTDFVKNTKSTTNLQKTQFF